MTFLCRLLRQCFISLGFVLLAACPLFAVVTPEKTPTFAPDAPVDTLGKTAASAPLTSDVAEVTAKAEAGDGPAQFALALRFLRGDGVEESREEGLRWLEKSAHTGYADAQFELSLIYQQKADMLSSAEAEVLDGAAPRDSGAPAAPRDSGAPTAPRDSGTTTMDKGSRQYNTASAVRWARAAAEQGHADAQVNYGYYLTNGYGVPKDEKEALLWYKKALAQGNAKARLNMAYAYFSGQGVAKNVSIAAQLFAEAAATGEPSAQHDYAICLNMLGGTANRKQALVWFEKAASQNYAPAIMRLVDFYDRGDVTRKNKKKALALLQKAAELNNAEAQNLLGVNYLLGKNVGKSIDVAMVLFMLAADQGHSGAAWNLGLLFEEGQTVQKSLPDALKWYKLAAELGNQEAAKKVKKLGR